MRYLLYLLIFLYSNRLFSKNEIVHNIFLKKIKINTKLYSKAILCSILLLISTFAFSQSVLPAPSGFKVTANECGKISLAWDDFPAGIEESYFEVYRSVSANGNFEFITNKNSNVLSHNDDSYGLLPNNTFYYKIRGNFNGTYSAYTETLIVSNTCPQPPTLTVTNSECGKIELAWNDFPSGTNYNGFEILRSETNQNSYYSIVSLPAGITSYANTSNLIANNDYRYQIRGKFNNSFTSNSNSVKGNFTCPNPPILQLGQASCGKIILNWADLPPEISENGYTIYRSNDGENGNYYSIGSTTANVLNYIDVSYGLLPNFRYFYKIKANIGGANTDFSNFVEAKFECPTPTNFRITNKTCGSISFAWDDMPNEIPELGYEIYYSKSGKEGNYNLFTNLNPN